MFKAVKEYRVRFAPIRLTKTIKGRMPYWYHLGADPEKRQVYQDNWGTCHRTNHQIRLVNDMINHAAKNNLPNHSNRRNCRCRECASDRERGCENPHACRKNASTKLTYLLPHWDPRNDENEQETDDEAELDEDEIRAISLRDVQEDEKDLRTHIQAFVDLDHKEPRNTGSQNADMRPDENHTVVYTDGSCTKNGETTAIAGAGLWYGENHARNKALKMPRQLSSNNGGELTAALCAVQDNKNTGKLTIISDSEYTIGAMTKHIPTWLDNGFVGTRNNNILRAIAGELINSTNQITLKKVKGHSGNEGNDGADKLAAEGAEKQTTDDINLLAGDEIKRLGINLNRATQSLLYRAIRATKENPKRVRTTRMLETIRLTLEEITGTNYPEKAIWNSLKQSDTIDQKTRSFIWKAIHHGHKIGEYWKHTDLRNDFMPCHHCDVEVESLEHILTECKASGQETIWKLAKELWAKTGKEWPHMSIGTALGISLMKIKNHKGKTDKGLTRLYQIITAESIYLIWLLRCEWRIGRGADQTKIHSRQEIENKWKFAINRRIRQDKALVNKYLFDRKALSHDLVKRTWQKVTEQDDPHMPGSDPIKWVQNMGVLVGIGNNRRPPGRNR